jgi:DNA repair protein RadC
MRVALAEDLSSGPTLTSRQEVFDLLKLELGARRSERLIAIYLDPGCHVLRYERISDGTPRGTDVPLRQIVAIGLAVGAAGILLVHNHPSGDPTPSDADRRMVARLSLIASDLDMHLLDAWIVAGDSLCSILK